MGATLGTPRNCPLCDELTEDPVVLKCDHRFCSRCIGDLWSTNPKGPYRCPLWKCKTVYKTLPFDRSLIKRMSSPSLRTQPSGNTATSKTNLSAPTRPSLGSRLLGKRKSSTQITDQPVPKQPSVYFPSELSDTNETPSTSASRSDESESEQPTTFIPQNPEVFPECTSPSPCDSLSSCNKCGSEMSPECNVPKNLPVQQSQSKPDVVIDLDSSIELDICEAPLLITPTNRAGDAGLHTPPKKATPTPTSGSSPQVSLPEAKPSVPFTKLPAATGHSSSYFSMSEKQDTVHCHYCPKSVYVSAVKTCLVCGASMCTEHLRPHLESPVFQNHTLVSPMVDTSAWKCQEHQETNRIYCSQCKVCVCTVCTVIGSHRDHACISIKEAERELRGNLKEEIKNLQNAEHQVNQRVAELTEKSETFTQVLSEAREGVKHQYMAIREVVEQEEQSALACVMKEERRVMDGLGVKLSQLHRSLKSIQKALHTLEGLADTKSEMHVQNQSFIMEYNSVTLLASKMSSCPEQFEAPEEVDRLRLKCLQRWMEKRLDAITISEPGKDQDLYRLLYGFIPVLDADTAHLKLRLSENNRKVTYTDSQQFYTEHEARFSCFPQVLASSALEGGCWYWEVAVSMDNGRWKVGLCEGQMESKGQKDNSCLGFNAHSWCMACDRKKVEAQHNKVFTPVAVDSLHKVGVFLNYEEGILSFFNVTPGGSLALLHSYKHRFSAPLFPAFSVSKTHLAICDLFHV